MKLATAWDEFVHDVMPASAPEIQKFEMRRAFYAGVAALLSTMNVDLEPGMEPTEKDMAMMDGIVAELHEFNEAVKRGDA